MCDPGLLLERMPQNAAGTAAGFPLTSPKAIPHSHQMGDLLIQRLVLPTSPMTELEAVVPSLSDELLLAANAISDQLGEVEEGPRREIQLLVAYCGLPFAEKYATRALRVHATKGVPRHDGKGNRTVGGIFFLMVKSTLERDDPRVHDLIFPDMVLVRKRREARKIIEALTALPRAALEARAQAAAASAKPVEEKFVPAIAVEPPHSKQTPSKEAAKPKVPRPAVSKMSANPPPAQLMTAATATLPRRRIVELSELSRPEPRIRRAPSSRPPEPQRATRS
jgi:hypothetical protein